MGTAARAIFGRARNRLVGLPPWRDAEGCAVRLSAGHRLVARHSGLPRERRVHGDVVSERSAAKLTFSIQNYWEIDDGDQTRTEANCEING